MVQLASHDSLLLDKCRNFRVQFLINGDRYFSGLSYLIRHDRITFEILCQDLSKVFIQLVSSYLISHSYLLSKPYLFTHDQQKSLPSGVRYIFDAHGHRIQSITDFRENAFYYVSSSRIFVGHFAQVPSESDTTTSGQSSTCSYRGERLANSLTGFISRVVAIVPGTQTGRTSRQIYRFLLTHRLMHKFETLLNELSKLGLGAVYHVYAYSNQQKVISCSLSSSLSNLLFLLIYR